MLARTYGRFLSLPLLTPQLCALGPVGRGGDRGSRCGEVPELDTAFSQARNGRLKRLEETLNLGLPIDADDEKGNTLLLVAAQNCNRKMVSRASEGEGWP